MKCLLCARIVLALDITVNEQNRPKLPASRGSPSGGGGGKRSPLHKEDLLWKGRPAEWGAHRRRARWWRWGGGRWEENRFTFGFFQRTLPETCFRIFWKDGLCSFRLTGFSFPA